VTYHSGKLSLSLDVLVVPLVKPRPQRPLLARLFVQIPGPDVVLIVPLTPFPQQRHQGKPAGGSVRSTWLSTDEHLSTFGAVDAIVSGKVELISAMSCHELTITDTTMTIKKDPTQI
jgi:hypothetical protein